MRRSPVILVSRPVLPAMACSSVGRNRLELSTPMMASSTTNTRTKAVPIVAATLWVLKKLLMGNTHERETRSSNHHAKYGTTVADDGGRANRTILTRSEDQKALPVHRCFEYCSA